MVHATSHWSEISIKFALRPDEESLTSSQVHFSHTITQTIPKKNNERTHQTDTIALRGGRAQTAAAASNCESSGRRRMKTTGRFFNYRAPAAVQTIDMRRRWRV